MKTIKFDDKYAKEVYSRTGSVELKETLESIFGKEFFMGAITDRVKTYEDACYELGEITVDVDDMLSKGFTMDEISYRKLKTIVRALNEGWVADFKDSDQAKWYPWFRMLSAGSGYVYTNYSPSLTTTYFGSRLCVKSVSLAEYLGKQFYALYNEFLF